MKTKDKGLLIVLCGPSGAGKGTVYNRVMDLRPKTQKSVSVTTRLPRAGEQEGVHYYFKTLEQYQQMIADGEFLETASVYSNHYGTPKAPVISKLDNGLDVMLEIDIIGAKQIKARYPDCILIFLMTPDFATLRKRLIERGTEKGSALENRLNSAKSELSEYKMFDYIVFNDSAERAAADIIGIIDSEKCRVRFNNDKILSLLKE